VSTRPCAALLCTLLPEMPCNTHPRVPPNAACRLPAQTPDSSQATYQLRGSCCGTRRNSRHIASGHIAPQVRHPCARTPWAARRLAAALALSKRASSGRGGGAGGAFFLLSLSTNSSKEFVVPSRVGKCSRETLPQSGL